MKTKLSIVATVAMVAGFLALMSLVSLAVAKPLGTNFTDAVNVACVDCATGTPALKVSQNSGTGGGKVFELGALNTPFAEGFRTGGVRIYAPTAQPTGVPGFVVDCANAGNCLELRYNGTPVSSFSHNSQADFWRYQDVAAAPSVYAQAIAVSTTTSITTSILGIETPRNLVLTYLTVTTATAGNVTVAGVNARGVVTTELIAVAATSGTQTLTGVMPWQSVTSFTLPTRTEAITLTAVGGQKFGLPRIPSASSDLFHLTVNATPQTAPTVNTTYGTFDPVSTPAASVDYNVWMK